MDKNLEKLEEDQEGDGVCESDQAQETYDRTHQRSSTQDEDRTHLRSHAKEGDRSQGDRSQPDYNRAQIWVKPKPAATLFWKFLVLGFCKSLLHKDSNPTIFRVSRILLESINRPVNIEKHRHAILEKNLRLSRKQFFGFILFLYFILWRWLTSISCVTKHLSRARLKPWSCLYFNLVLAPLR